MLKKKLNYICFDFETTWLDVEKDEAIQIWIIKFNHKFEITDKFSSYIKPKNFDQLQNLSEIVEFTTGIKLETLKSAPEFSQIQDKIKSFFNSKSILIWHNINFDINFLKKYIPDFDYFDIFDTYIYSRLLLHFEPSYALEILADKYWFKWQSHDALADSIMSMKLFKIIIKKIEKLLKKYPFLADIILKSDSIFWKILKLEKTNTKVFSIPKKWANIPKPKKLKTKHKPITNYNIKTVFNVSETCLEDTLNFALNENNKVILAFSSNARLNCAKNILKQKYINFSPLNNGYILSEENEKKLLNKNQFTPEESHYILKAFSHYVEDLSIFDITNFEEAKIYNFLADKRRNISSNILLTTHYDLFNFLKNNKEKIKDYIIVFFDWHYWMNSLSSIINKGFDFYDFLNLLEIFKYKLSYEWKEKDIEYLINQVSTLFGLFWIKLQPVFKWTNNKVEIINLIENPQNWLNQLKEPFLETDKLIQNLKEKYSDYPDTENIVQNWNILKECITNYCIIEQKIAFGWKLKYIFHPLMENVDINTFNDFMNWTTYYCLTTIDKPEYEKITSEIIEPNLVDLEKNLDFKKLVEKISKDIKEWKSIYLISNNKNFSNNLFKLIFNLFKEHNLSWNIYAENITWWQWKLLYYLKKDKDPKITIWGPEFLIQNQSKNITYDEYLILNLQWKQRPLVIKDLNFYLRKLKNTFTP